MTRPSLSGIEKRAAAATEGPWTTSGPDTIGEGVIYGPTRAVAYQAWVDPKCDDNAQLIAHARTDLPALTAAVRDVIAECERFRLNGRGAPDDTPTEFDEGVDTVASAILRALAAHLDLTDPEGDPT